MAMPSRAQSFRFLDDPNAYREPTAFVVRLPSGVAGKSELLNLLYERLILPGYFGFNWDALSDCLRDFHWIREVQVALIHEDLPQLPEEDLRIYLSVLAHAVLDWNRSDEHALEIVFPEAARATINRLFR